MANEIIGVGLATVDHLFVTTQRGDHFSHAEDFLSQGGGLTATAVAAAGRLGAGVEIWTVIGDDFGGRFVIEECRKDNVDTSHVCVVPDGATATCGVLVDNDTGERRFVFFGGRELGGRHEFDLSRIDNAKCLLVDPHMAADAVVAAEHAQEAGVPVVADIEALNESSIDLARLSDILIVPQECAGDFCGSSEPAEYVSALRKLGPRMIVVTMGESGGVYAGRLRAGEDEAGLRSYDAFNVDVVDTTGCGDVFHGAFAFGLTRGWNAERIIRFASATAALKCRKIGGRSGIPTLEEVERFLRR